MPEHRKNPRKGPDMLPNLLGDVFLNIEPKPVHSGYDVPYEGAGSVNPDG